MNYKLAVIGMEGTAAIYRMLGVDVYTASSSSAARELVEKLMKQFQPGTETPEYAVLFIEEDFHAEMPVDLIEKLTKRALPAVVPVPTPASETGKKSYGVKRLYSIVERAIGSNILG